MHHRIFPMRGRPVRFLVFFIAIIIGLIVQVVFFIIKSVVCFHVVIV